MWSRGMKQVNAFIEEHVIHRIPSRSVKELHPKLLFPTVLIIISVMFAFFLALFVNGYEAQINEKFLSPASSSDSSLCDDVIIPNTGQYLLSYDGYWEGAPGFSYGRAKYVMQVANFGVDDSGYEQIVDFLHQVTSDIGQRIAPASDLATILLYWTSFSVPQPDNPTNRFYMNANPATIFNRRFTTGALSNQFHDCRNLASTHFDRANSVLQMVFNLDEYLHSNCTLVADPVTLGFASSPDAKDFTIQIDVRSLVTAIAINIGIVSLDDIQVVEGTNSTVSIDSYSVSSASYIDPRYPGMLPVLCTRSTIFRHCAMVLGSVYALPLFMHRGASTLYPSPCDCAGEAGQRSNDPTYDCNLFQFLSGFIFYPTLDQTPLIELGLRYSDAEILSESFPAMFAGSLFGETAAVNASFRNDSYAFCRVSSYPQGCSFVIFSSTDGDSFQDSAVSDYYLQLQTGACGDSFSASTAVWDRAKATPYAALKQEYVICRNNALQAWIDNLGVASGLVQIVLPVWLLIVLGTVISLVPIRLGFKVTRRYTPTEREAVLDLVATALLNEQNIPHSTRRSSKTILRLLTEELRGEVKELAANEALVYGEREKHPDGAARALSLSAMSTSSTRSLRGLFHRHPKVQQHHAGHLALARVTPESSSFDDEDRELEPLAVPASARITSPAKAHHPPHEHKSSVKMLSSSVSASMRAMNEPAAAALRRQQNDLATAQTLQVAVPTLLGQLEIVRIALADVRSRFLRRSADFGDDVHAYGEASSRPDGTANISGDGSTTPGKKLALSAVHSDGVYDHAVTMLQENLRSPIWSLVGDRNRLPRLDPATRTALRPVWQRLITTLSLHAELSSQERGEDTGAAQYCIGEHLWRIPQLTAELRDIIGNEEV